MIFSPCQGWKGWVLAKTQVYALSASGDSCVVAYGLPSAPALPALFAAFTGGYTLASSFLLHVLWICSGDALSLQKLSIMNPSWLRMGLVLLLQPPSISLLSLGLSDFGTKLFFLLQSGSLPILINGEHPSPRPPGLSPWFLPLHLATGPIEMFPVPLVCPAMHLTCPCSPGPPQELRLTQLRVLPSRAQPRGQGRNEQGQSISVMSPNCAQGWKQEVRAGNEWLLATCEH